METYLRIGLLGIAIIIVSLILLQSWYTRRRLKITDQSSATAPLTANLLVLSVMAKPNCQFSSYELLQAIMAAGLQFGEMNIFHYNVQEKGKKITLFSLASATKPGDFNLDKIGEFSCAGLTLFLDLKSVPDPRYAFEVMLAAAEQLAEDLDGELRAGQRIPWSEETRQQYQEKALQC